MPTSNSPNYVNSDLGWPVFRGPYMQEGAEMAAFFLKADYDALTTILNKYLNEPMGADAPYQFEPLTSYTILVYADMTVYSLNAIDTNIGKMNETDLCFWIPTIKHKRQADGSYTFDGVVWFIPYLFVNNPYAISTGREVYGFRKSLTSFEKPEKMQDPTFSSQTLAFKTFSADARAEETWLMKVTHAEDQPEERVASFESGQEMTEALINMLRADEKGAAKHPLFDKIINWLLKLIKPALNVVFLKQFRDVVNTNKAAYQAVVEAPITVRKFYGGGLPGRNYRIQFNTLESHPLIQQMGLTADEENVVDSSWYANAWLKIDFVAENGTVLWQAKPKKQKVAILGGGMGSMTTAFELTSDPDWQQKYDITLYQMGWRLGGKGASGRNQAQHDSIEEHGLHIFMGFYHNAFRVMREVYGELDRPADAPLATWQDAFKPHNYIAVTNYHKGEWYPFGVNFPPRSGLPGDPTPQKSSKDLFDLLMMTMKEQSKSLRSPELYQESAIQIPDHVARRASELGHELGDSFHDLHHLMTVAHDVARHTDTETSSTLTESFEPHATLKWLLGEIASWVWKLITHRGDAIDDVRLVLLALYFAAVNALGMLRDGVILHGFDVIEDIDYRAWLNKHEIGDAAANSVFTRAFYDLVFAYVKGSTGNQTPTIEGNIAAGTALHALLLLIFDYKGAIMWKMQAGMGDVIFAPMYEVLKRRGVKFEFFHKVEALQPNESQTEIDKIVIQEQATLKNGSKSYSPLIDVKGLPCWPSEPLYDQLEQGDELKNQHINLESSWANWDGVGTKTLERGKDYDLVVLGISLAALKTICSELITAKPAWQAMMDNVLTVQTQAAQIWFDKDLAALGWTRKSPILDAYVEPLNTWADMTQLIDKETWPEGDEPKNVAYFCGVLEDAEVIPPPSDHTFPQTQTERVEKYAADLLTKHMKVLWPNLDQATVMEKYFRANIDPTERYVLSVAGSSKHRLKADESGYNNLYLTGDWIDNGWMNVGAIEPTVVAALQTSKAIREGQTE